MKFHKTLLLFLILISLLLTNCSTLTPEIRENVFDQTVAAHLNAIQNRDLNELLNTVDKEVVTLILPNGELSQTTKEYEKINSEWFEDKHWSIDADVVQKRIQKETGIALIKITYHEKEASAADRVFQYYLTLVFTLQNNEWKLIFDQNTIIKQPEI